MNNEKKKERNRMKTRPDREVEYEDHGQKTLWEARSRRREEGNRDTNL